MANSAPVEGGGANGEPRLLAAVDLGSNSFHLITARWVDGELRIVDRLRERVGIAAGLDADNYITEEAQERALECLERFGERLRTIPIGNVNAVGTNTFRQGRNGRAFLDRAEIVLGHPINIISGQEEARLIYTGVSYTLSPEPGRRLVVDIGGGSTECILGEGHDMLEGESLLMGCVSYSLRFFPDGILSRDRFREAEIAARLELQGLEHTFHPTDGVHCLGTSGTVNSVQRILQASGWSDAAITLEGLEKLRKALLAAESVRKLDLPELRTDRKPVLPGGLAILIAVFESLGLARMAASPAALREGLLHDLAGRIHHEDLRNRTIRAMMQRFGVDEAQALRVERTVLHLLAETTEAWGLDGETSRRCLSWAARLHEAGLSISHIGYHKHGEYLITHSEMAGFSREDQMVVAALVRAHRRKLPAQIFEGLPHVSRRNGLRLCLLLRLAALLHRTRTDQALPLIRAVAEKGSIELVFPRGWLDEHPLTGAVLQKEASVLAGAGYQLILH